MSENMKTVKVKSSFPHKGEMVSPGATIEVNACHVVALVQEGRIHAPDETPAKKPAK